MPYRICRANIDGYLEALHDVDLPADERAIVIKLLIEEENKLSKFEGQLEFVESRAARGRELLNHSLTRLNNSKHLADHAEAARVFSNLKSIQHLLDSFCRQLRSPQNSVI